MNTLHVKKGDTVYVNSGNSKGQTGKVLQVLVKERRAIVEGVNMVSKLNPVVDGKVVRSNGKARNVKVKN